MNHVGLVGRTTKDAMIRHLSEGRVQTNFVLAINRTYKNSEGMVDADFISCVAWGKTAEAIVKYCGKGSLIGVKGRLQSRTYLNRENQKVYTMEVNAEDVRFYALKTPGETDATTAPPPISEDFVLPEHESELVEQP
ncbi:single-stranded DNA-binding protein [Solibacillus silvestris]|uniref:single-stranded DNA-binding protein n=1 Tax=Solibacillus silvestris TaxID=76853 RepID=UPI003F7E4BAB